jgi:hypothetical protein
VLQKGIYTRDELLEQVTRLISERIQDAERIRKSES